jgi:hypothetical protein
MTIKQTLDRLRAMGCKARWSSEWREYRVTLPGLSPEREEAVAAYCEDWEEALANGAAMVGLS